MRYFAILAGLAAATVLAAPVWAEARTRTQSQSEIRTSVYIRSQSSGDAAGSKTQITVTGTVDGMSSESVTIATSSASQPIRIQVKTVAPADRRIQPAPRDAALPRVSQTRQATELKIWVGSVLSYVKLLFS
jgi:hypothetical protein